MSKSTTIKKDIVERIYEKHGGISRDEASGYVTEILNILGSAIQGSEKVTIKDFGSFRAMKVGARRIKMPDGHWTRSLDHMRVQFKPSPKLKLLVNQSGESDGT